VRTTPTDRRASRRNDRSIGPVGRFVVRRSSFGQETFAFMTSGGAGGDAGIEPGVISKLSPRSVSDTVARFTDMLGSKGVKVFSVIDQRAEARSAGLDLRETVLVIFGNPAAGTGVMEAVPLSAIDLPLKVLVWADGDRGTQVSYTSPATLAARYGLTPELTAPLEVLNGLTDALVAG
jgi:uncharacterized protein (DUF302 family)